MAQQPILSQPQQASASTKQRLQQYPTPIDTSGLVNDGEYDQKNVERKKKEFVHNMSNSFYQQQQQILNQCNNGKKCEEMEGKMGFNEMDQFVKFPLYILNEKHINNIISNSI